MDDSISSVVVPWQPRTELGVVSSAYNMRLNSSDALRNMLNSRGQSTEPCITAVITSCFKDM